MVSTRFEGCDIKQERGLGSFLRQGAGDNFWWKLTILGGGVSLGKNPLWGRVRKTLYVGKRVGGWSYEGYGRG